MRSPTLHTSVSCAGDCYPDLPAVEWVEPKKHDKDRTCVVPTQRTKCHACSSRLQVPFPGMAVGQVFWAVAVNNERPDIPADCPEDYAQLMTSCWDADPAARPTFAELRQVLMNMFQRLRVASPSPSRSSEVSSKKEASTGGSQDAPTADPDIPGGRDEAVLAVVPDL